MSIIKLAYYVSLLTMPASLMAYIETIIMLTLMSTCLSSRSVKEAHTRTVDSNDIGLNIVQKRVMI